MLQEPIVRASCPHGGVHAGAEAPAVTRLRGMFDKAFANFGHEKSRRDMARALGAMKTPPREADAKDAWAVR